MFFSPVFGELRQASAVFYKGHDSQYTQIDWVYHYCVHQAEEKVTIITDCWLECKFVEADNLSQDIYMSAFSRSLSFLHFKQIFFPTLPSPIVVLSLEG